MIRRIAKSVLAASLSVVLLSAFGCPTDPGKNEIVISGTVFAALAGSSNANAPATPINPVAGAVVSTSLTGRTATTDAAGHFSLHTEFDDHQCSTYTVKVTASGLPTYEKQWTGGGPHDTQFEIVLSVGWPLESTSTTCVKR